MESIYSKFQEKESIDILEKQLPHWKLILGLSLISGMIRYYADETVKIISGNETWNKIKNNNA
jgi:hypothetical protein